MNPEDDSEWDLVCCEVPVASAVKRESELIDHVSDQLDELQLSLKGLLGRERAVLKRQLDSPEDLGEEEPSALPLLCELSRQVGAVEPELVPSLMKSYCRPRPFPPSRCCENGGLTGWRLR